MVWHHVVKAAVLFRLGQGVALLTAAKSELNTYTFEDFVRTFHPDLRRGSHEYEERASLFRSSLAQIHAINTRNSKEGRTWQAGVHPFMDWTKAEKQKLHGYKPSRDKGGRHAQRRARVSFLDEEAWTESKTNASAAIAAADSKVAIRNQGDCGSCWAISAVEAVEAQLARKAGQDVQLSAQALLNCVPNPDHCGGSGGCDGATGELAFAFIRDNGIPLESDQPYFGTDGMCGWQGPSRYNQKRAVVSGWNALPTNTLQPLMQALVEQGPAVVAVDADNWLEYSGGIFDSCSKDAMLGHAVLLKGYGEEDVLKYWLIQNSWGERWGEDGDIRLRRRDDEESHCGIDYKPQEGVGCDGGPDKVTVCGTCGILYDALVPVGARLIDADDTKSSDAGGGSASMVAFLGQLGR